ncbi:MAG: general secretion pathway protein GspB [Luteimonas sp.]
MSLILEALRKSEAERRRAQAPDLRAELPPAPARRHVAIPAWAWLLPASAVLLAAVWLMRTPDRASPSSVATDTGATIHREKTPALPVVPRLSPPAVVAIPKPAPVERTPEVSPPPSPAVAQPAIVAAPKSIPIPDEPVPPPVAPPADAGDGDLLQLSDLSAAERKSLPPLKVSMHMWDGDAARRFVIVDGNRLVEGDRIGAAVVTAITTDGVLLDWNGRRLKLPIR